MTKIDPKKSIDKNYPALNFEAAFNSNLSLYNAERECTKVLNKKFEIYVYIWEYGFYFMSLFIHHSKIHKSYIILAALVTEIQSAIRTAFLLNIQGYHADSVVLLRKAHESFVRALASKANPKQIWNIIQAKDVVTMGNKIKLDLKQLYAVESSYTHSNKMKSFKSGIDLQSGSDNCYRSSASR